MLTINDLVIQQKVTLILTENHEIDAHSVLRLVSGIVFVHTGVFYVSVFGIERAILRLELRLLVRELVYIHRNKGV
jgi:hypothetical protein